VDEVITNDHTLLLFDYLNDTYPNRRINKSTVLKAIERSRETGSVKNRSKSRRPLSATNEEQQLVLQTLIENPNSSVVTVIPSALMRKREPEELIGIPGFAGRMNRRCLFRI